MCCASARSSRAIVEECLLWANQRKVFGKSLLQQPVIREKLSRMIAMVEATQAWLEVRLSCSLSLVAGDGTDENADAAERYVPDVSDVVQGAVQGENKSFPLQCQRRANLLLTLSQHLAGQVAFLKMYCTQCAQEVSDEAIMIFGFASPPS